MRNKKRVTFLDFITIIGLALIILAHLPFSNDLELFISDITPVSIGIIGNLLFFFRSGFGLYNSDKTSWFVFFRNRLLRVIPPLFLTTTAIMAAALFFDPLKLNYDGRLNLGTYIANAFGIQEFFNISRINPITWFMSYLLLYYLLFPIFYKLISKSNIRFFVGSLLVLVFTFFISNIKGYIYLPKISYYFAIFLLGMALAKFWNKIKIKFYSLSGIIIIAYFSISLFLFNIDINNFVIAIVLIILGSSVNFSKLISRFLTFVSEYSYYILLVHIPVIASLYKIYGMPEFIIYFIFICAFLSIALKKFDALVNRLSVFSNKFK